MKIKEFNELTQSQPDTQNTGMAQNQLLKIGQHAIKIENMIADNQEISEWASNKINLASDYVKKIHNTLSEFDNPREKPQVRPVTNMDPKELGDRIEKAKAKAYKRPEQLDITKLWTKEKPATEVAPPGREKQVKALKGKVDNPYAVAWASYNKSKGKNETGAMSSADVDRVRNQSFSDKQIKMAFGVLNDPRFKGGNYTGAYNVINKIAPGLADHPSVANALRRANEDGYPDLKVSGRDKLMFGDKEIDQDSIVYDMQDASDMIFELHGAKFVDGTDLNDQELEALEATDELQDWVRIDHATSGPDAPDDYPFEDAGTSPLKETARMAIELIEILKNGGSIDESTQNILNQAADNLHGVYNYESYAKTNPYREELDSNTLNKHAGVIQKGIDNILATETPINDIDTKPGMLRILNKKVNEVEKELAKEVRENMTYEDMLQNKLDKSMQEYDTPEKKAERDALMQKYLKKGGKVEKVPAGKTAYKNKELKPAYRKDNGTPITSPGSDESIGEDSDIEQQLGPVAKEVEMFRAKQKELFTTMVDALSQDGTGLYSTTTAEKIATKMLSFNPKDVDHYSPFNKESVEEDISEKGRIVLEKAGFDPNAIHEYMAVFNDHGDTTDLEDMNTNKIGVADAMAMVLASHDVENESAIKEDGPPFGSGMELLRMAIMRKFITVQEWDLLKHKWNDAADEVEQKYADWPEGEGFGSSDHNFAIRDLMSAVGYEFDDQDTSGRFVVIKQPEEIEKAGIKNVRMKGEPVATEGGMPASIIKHKQKLAHMSDEELADRFKDFDEKRLRHMAWGHGYGKMSSHYLDRVKNHMTSKRTGTTEEMGPGFAVRYSLDGKRKVQAYKTEKDAQHRAEILRSMGGVKDVSITTHTLNFKKESAYESKLATMLNQRLK